MLLYVTPEVNKIRTKLKLYKDCILKINEEKGFVYLHLSFKTYFMVIKITVEDEYPQKSLSFKVIKSNLPSQIYESYLIQAAEMSRILSNGGAKINLNIRNLTRNLDRIQTTFNSDLPVHLTKDYVNSLKADVNVLKKLSDLEKVDKSYNKQLHKYDYSTDIRKESRREMRKLTKSELLKEKQNLEKQKKQIIDHQLKLLDKQQPPERSLQQCAFFLVDEFWFKLEHILCPTTQEKVFDFSLSPEAMKELFSKRTKKRPVRVNCGCWFKYYELNKFLTEPPFGKECPGINCNKVRVFHKDWSTNIKHLEKQYAMKMAREREINEVAEFFQLDDAFRKD